ncbi:EAL domain-containing protein [Vibrio brasiliensis]
MILSTKQQFVDCLSINENSQYVGTYKDLKLNSVFQPIFDRQDKVIGVEALVRIQREGHGCVRPDLFFHSDQTDFDDKINVERLSRVIHIRNFARSKYRHLQLFLNVLPSAGEYLAIESIDSCLLNQRLRALELSSSQIVMEVIELVASSEENLRRAMGKLAENNFTIAVDDYGINASNQKRVEALRPGIIKIDRTLMLSYMDGDKNGLLSSIKLAKKLNAKTVIEGIETQEQLDAMRQLEIDMFQGYFLAMPAPLEVIHQLATHDFEALSKQNVTSGDLNKLS